MISLRPYQEQALADIRSAIKQGFRRICFVAPTGMGKTAIMTYMASATASNNKNTVFLVHRNELLTQASRAFSNNGVKHGCISPRFTPNKEKIQIASVQTLSRRLHLLPDQHVVICDENHHSPSNTHAKIINHFPSAISIGLTATPERLDGKGLGELYDTIVLGPTMRWLIDNQYLAEYIAYAPQHHVDFSSLHTRAGDYASEELEELLDKPKIIGDIISNYCKLGQDKPAICFAVSIEHSKHIAAEFNRNGIPAAHVDGAMNNTDRDDAFFGFASGKYRILCNVNLATEGVDIPTAKVCIMARPTQSITMYLQSAGRVLRFTSAEDKAIIIDHVGNILRHGLPCDEREWSLDGRKKKKRGAQEQNFNVRSCPECFNVHRIAAVCPQCGFRYEITGREIENVDGELIEVDVLAARVVKKREQASARSIDELVELGKQRGYKNPHAWAKYVYGARGNKWGKHG